MWTAVFLSLLTTLVYRIAKLPISQSKQNAVEDVHITRTILLAIVVLWFLKPSSTPDVGPNVNVPQGVAHSLTPHQSILAFGVDDVQLLKTLGLSYAMNIIVARDTTKDPTPFKGQFHKFGVNITELPYSGLASASDVAQLFRAAQEHFQINHVIVSARLHQQPAMASFKDASARDIDNCADATKALLHTFQYLAQVSPDAAPSTVVINVPNTAPKHGSVLHRSIVAPFLRHLINELRAATQTHVCTVELDQQEDLINMLTCLDGGDVEVQTQAEDTPVAPHHDEQEPVAVAATPEVDPQPSAPVEPTRVPENRQGATPSVSGRSASLGLLFRLYGFFLPATATLKMISAGNSAVLDDDSNNREQVYCYWMIFAVVCLVDDYFLPVALQSFLTLPQLAFLAWCGAIPGGKGAALLYAQFVAPARTFIEQAEQVVAQQIVPKKTDDEFGDFEEVATPDKDIDQDQDDDISAQGVQYFFHETVDGDKPVQEDKPVEAES